MKNHMADMILISSSIFKGTENSVLDGFIAVKGNNILAVEEGGSYENYLCEGTKVINLGNKTICPGFADTHTFFTGYVIEHLGVDLRDINTDQQLREKLIAYIETQSEKQAIFGHNLPNNFINNKIVQDILEGISPNKPVVLFNSGHNTCAMNQSAINRFEFTPAKCYSEAIHKIMKLYLTDRDFIDKEFEEYMYMLNSNGITAVKEMGFDDYYGFTEVLKDFEDNNKLTVRISFMSQPVGEKMNLSYGRKMRDKFQSEFVRFSGYNQMTDGLILTKNGHVLEPYIGTEIHCLKNINYPALEQEVLEADKNGFRYTLHSEGDAAFKNILDIYGKCKKKDGKLIHRHGITDLEMTDKKDRIRMAELGVFGEIYAQVIGMDTYDNWVHDYEAVIGRERTSEYLNYRDLTDQGVVLAAATDLPLLIPNIPESIYYGCANYCKDKMKQFNPNNGLTITEMLKAWTINSQYALEQENILGTLEKDKRADIAIFDSNIFEVPMEDMLSVKVAMTIVDGKIVYQI